MRIAEETKTTAMLLAPALFFILAILIGSSIEFPVRLKGIEKRAINYHTGVEELPVKKKYARTTVRKDPFDYVFVRIVKPSKPLAKGAKTERAKKEEAIKLTLTIIGRQKSFAILNGKTLQEGSYYRGYRVEEILKDRVVLKRDGQVRTIFLEE